MWSEILFLTWPQSNLTHNRVAQISDEMEIDDVDSEDDNFENVSSDEEGYQSGCDERDEFTFEINVDEELIKYAKDF